MFNVTLQLVSQAAEGSKNFQSAPHRGDTNLYETYEYINIYSFSGAGVLNGIVSCSVL